ncbi:hypothetical protein AN221_25205 [Streptomyces nanshensis]|uniref:Uncharacterized protein n=1 Tax=Streptomyces nanshensis TaxID=518642 RepID=A0A1E7LP03_9ACTN|nr:hypothetical protein AN221_25205 [Streptomyces nanshensis]
MESTHDEEGGREEGEQQEGGQRPGVQGEHGDGEDEDRGGGGQVGQGGGGEGGEAVDLARQPAEQLPAAVGLQEAQRGRAHGRCGAFAESGEDVFARADQPVAGEPGEDRAAGDQGEQEQDPAQQFGPVAAARHVDDPPDRRGDADRGRGSGEVEEDGGGEGEAVSGQEGGGPAEDGTLVGEIGEQRGVSHGAVPVRGRGVRRVREGWRWSVRCRVP